MITIFTKFGDAENLPKPLPKSTSKHTPKDQIGILSAFELMNVGDTKTLALYALRWALTGPRVCEDTLLGHLSQFLLSTAVEREETGQLCRKHRMIVLELEGDQDDNLDANVRSGKDKQLVAMRQFDGLLAGF